VRVPLVVLIALFVAVALYSTRALGTAKPWPREVARRIDRGLSGTPMSGLGRSLEVASRRVNVNPALLAGIAGVESSFGEANSGSYNPFGWGPGIDFASWPHAFSSVANGIRSRYINLWGARNLWDLGRNYCPGCSTWPGKVASFMGRFRLGLALDYPDG
jgi:hypothetical protein